MPDLTIVFVMAVFISAMVVFFLTAYVLARDVARYFGAPQYTPILLTGMFVCVFLLPTAIRRFFL